MNEHPFNKIASEWAAYNAWKEAEERRDHEILLEKLRAAGLLKGNLPDDYWTLSYPEWTAKYGSR